MGLTIGRRGPGRRKFILGEEMLSPHANYRISNTPSRRDRLSALTSAAVLGIVAVASGATITDITDGLEHTVNGAKFQQYNFGASGTGTISPFLRLQAQGNSTTSTGYNTDGTVEFDTNTDPHTHSITLNNVPIVSHTGVEFYEFLLDTGEPGNDTHSVNIDNLQIFLSPTGNNSGYPVIGDLVYELDSVDDVGIRMDGAFGNGNGSTDALIFLPKAIFDTYFAVPANTGKNETNSYLYFYIALSDSNGSFEEVAVRTIEPRTPPPPPIVPLPAASVGGLLLLGALSVTRRRSQNA